MARVLANVTLGDGAVVDDTAILGLQPAGAQAGALATRIGPNAVIRSHAVIYAGTTIGARFNAGHGALVREENVLGDDVSVGTNAAVERGNRIGDRVRIHTGCFVASTVLEDDVFVGPNVVFTDDPHPMCPRYLDCRGGAVVRRFVSIGANVTVLPGVEIGEGSLIGAGSVLTRNVPAGVVAAGNPAEVVKRIDELVCWPGFFPRPYAWRDGG